MDRRAFLKVTGLTALAGAAVGGLRAARLRPGQAASSSDGVRLAIREPGTYRIAGRVRLEAAEVEISGIGETQRISWSGPASAARPTASFATFEHFEAPGLTAMISVRGGSLESVTAMPVDYA